MSRLFIKQGIQRKLKLVVKAVRDVISGMLILECLRNIQNFRKELKCWRYGFW